MVLVLVIGLMRLLFLQLAQGISEFKPTPSENLECFKNSYNVKRTLLVFIHIVVEKQFLVNVSFDGIEPFQVKFDSDTIDETDRLEETLKPRVESFGGKVEKIALTGNHITPCIQVTCTLLHDLLYSLVFISHRNILGYRI